MTKYTALPWRCNVTSTLDRVTVPIQTPDGQMLIKASGLPKKGVMLANARFIVTACNCHADLLEALKLTAAINIDKYDACDEPLQEAWNAAVEAIRKVEE